MLAAERKVAAEPAVMTGELAGQTEEMPHTQAEDCMARTAWQGIVRGRIHQEEVVMDLADLEEVATDLEVVEKGAV